MAPRRLSPAGRRRRPRLASSALYRYFPSRDALLTRPASSIAYDAVEKRPSRRSAGSRGRADPVPAGLAVCGPSGPGRSRTPHEYALVYGSPVPGYAAPQDTVEPAVRLSRVMAGIVVTAYEDGSLRPPHRPYRGPRLVAPGVVEVVGSLPPAPYEDALERSFVLLVALTGAISYLLFGHLHLALLDDDAWFDLAMAVAAEGVGLDLPLG
jgi:hypothetical protein